MKRSEWWVMMGAIVWLAVQSVQASIYVTNDVQMVNLKTVETWTAEEREAAKERSGEVLVERALRVDRKLGEVVVLAEFCDISAATTIEFPICGELSDRDYESLFRTFAEPGAIARALESLGVPRGKNVDYRTQNLWAQGERVMVEVAAFGGGDETYVPIQRYIMDREKKNYLDVEGFVYCGSVDDEKSGRAGVRLCDSEAPNAVLSTYNERQSVLDMPIFCPQSRVYERFHLAEGSGLKPFGMYKIRFRPIRRGDGRGTARYCEVKIGREGIGQGAVGGIVYEVKEKEKSEGGVFTNRVEMVGHFRSMVGEGLDVFVTISFSDELTIEEAKEQAEIFESIDGDEGIRVVAPAEDSLFYKGFLPNEMWREVGNRPTQPWELRFGGEGGIEMIKTDEDWTSSDSLDPILTTTEFRAGSAEEADMILKKNDKDPPALGVLLVFARGEALLSEVMPTLRLVKGRYPTVYVFAARAPADNGQRKSAAP